MLTNSTFDLNWCKMPIRNAFPSKYIQIFCFFFMCENCNLSILARKFKSTINEFTNTFCVSDNKSIKVHIASKDLKT